MWGLAALPLLALARAERLLASEQREASASPVVFYCWTTLYLDSDAHLAVWQPALWAALVAAASVVPALRARAIEGARDLAERLWAGRSPTLPDARPASPTLRWGLNWRRACTPDAGLRVCLRATALVGLQVLLVGAACFVLGPIAAVALGHATAAPLVARAAKACLIVLPLIGAALAAASWIGGMTQNPPQSARWLLPLHSRRRWTTLLLTGVIHVCLFAALAVGLGAGGLAVIRAVGGVRVATPSGLFWLPAVFGAPALVAWAQEPLIRHPIRLVPGGEKLFWGLTLVLTLGVVPAALALADVRSPWPVVAAVVLWPTAALAVLASRVAVEPATWTVKPDGKVPTVTSYMAQLALLLAAASLSLALDCSFMALMGALFG